MRAQEKRGVCYRTDRIAAIADTIAAFQDPQQRSLLNIYPLSVLDNLLEDFFLKNTKTYLLGFQAANGSVETGVNTENDQGCCKTTSDHTHFPRIDHEMMMISSWKAHLVPKLHDESKKKKPISNTSGM